MTKEQVKPGKLYRNRENKFLYDTILCVTDMRYDGGRLLDSFVEYYWIKRPNKVYYTTLVTALLEWDPVE